MVAPAMGRNRSVAVRLELSFDWSAGRSTTRSKRLTCLPSLGAAREATRGRLGVVCQCQVELNIVPIASRPLNPVSSVATLVERRETFSRLNSGNVSSGHVDPINELQQRPKGSRHADVALKTQ
jgi:hypothetical protein